MLKIEEVGHGVIAEKFEDELAKVVGNIMDPNTEAKTQRKITLELKIMPDPEDRTSCDLEVVSSVKLAAAKSYVSKLAVGVNRITGEVGAEEIMKLQPSLFQEETDTERQTA